MYMGSMSRLKGHRLEEEEEALGVLWHRREAGQMDEAVVREVLSKGVSTRVFDRLVKNGSVLCRDSRVELTEKGDALGREIIRRHRLAERLLSDLLEIAPDSVDSDACQWEHVLSPKATQAICTLLGHPAHCPHGTPIPPGPCCSRRSEHAAPLITPLDGLAPGSSGRILYLALEDGEALKKLLALGLTPGTGVSLKQRSPAVVVQAGETVVALEESVARHIFVRKD
ncbi:MAG: metal-dependent transcriptional regulator [Elusimicrobiota bacterium]|jgi:DtxR family Mn-dependent transcriptional regulator